MSPDEERQLAIDLYNDLWPLMELEHRTPDDDARLVHEAHTSLYHWSKVGTAVNVARGEWMCARVYAVLGRAEPALYHARRCLALAEPIGGWDLAVAYEALARACVVDGDQAEARGFLELARAVPIAEDDDRAVVEKDLAAVEALLG